MVILQFLFFIVIAILLFVVAVVGIFVFSAWNTVKSFFGMRPKQEHPDVNMNVSGGKPRTSQIDKNEGEYVDYEEID